MTKLSDLELFGILEHLYRKANNSLVRHQVDEDEYGPVFVEREPAVLLHRYDIDMIEEVADPRDAFVTTSELAKYTGYSRDTIRRRMENLTKVGIVVDHGDITNRTGDHTDHLYMPADVDSETLFTRLHEQDGRTPPASLTDRTEVVPSDFDHLEGGRFKYTGRQEVDVNVDQPDGEINSQVAEQLHAAGLTPTDLSNFTYQLRRRAGLV